MSLRLNGQFLLAGAIVSIVAAFLYVVIPGPYGYNGPGSLPANVVALLSGLLLLVGLPALYRAQATQMRRLGWAGVALFWGAVVLLLLVLTGVQILDVAVPGSIPHPGGEGPPPAAVIPDTVGAIMLLIGGVIVGIKTIQAHRFVAAIGWLLIIGSVCEALMQVLPLNEPLNTILTSLFLIVLSLGLGWAGATLNTQGAPTPAPDSEAQWS